MCIFNMIIYLLLHCNINNRNKAYFPNVNNFELHLLISMCVCVCVCINWYIIKQCEVK